MVRHDFPFVKPCCPLPTTFLSSICLEIVTRMICSIIVSGIDVRLASLSFPVSSSLKTGVLWCYRDRFAEHPDSGCKPRQASRVGCHLPNIRLRPKHVGCYNNSMGCGRKRRGIAFWMLSFLLSDDPGTSGVHLICWRASAR